MRMTSLLRERGRVLALLLGAALLLVVSLWLPIWTMSLEAPQYPNGLYMQAYGTRVEGDLREINIINHYVGMAPIDAVPAPEMALFPWAMTALAVGVVLSVLHRRLLQAAFVVTLALPFGIIADLQWWLHRFGQNLDPTAPLRFVEPFTPLALGISKIGNFRSIAMVSYGFFTMILAAALLYFALRAWPRAETVTARAAVAAEARA